MTGEAAVLSAVLRAVSGHFAAVYGRGPEFMRGHIDGGALTVIAEGVLTRFERTAIVGGGAAATIQARRAVLSVTSAALVEGVAAAAGRSVRAFFHDVDLELDAAVLTFLFA